MIRDWRSTEGTREIIVLVHVICLFEDLGSIWEGGSDERRGVVEEYCPDSLSPCTMSVIMAALKGTRYKIITDHEIDHETERR